jgi:hypothetical protein
MIKRVIPSESRGIPVRHLKRNATGSLDFARDDGLRNYFTRTFFLKNVGTSKS